LGGSTTPGPPPPPSAPRAAARLPAPRRGCAGVPPAAGSGMQGTRAWCSGRLRAPAAGPGRSLPRPPPWGGRTEYGRGGTAPPARRGRPGTHSTRGGRAPSRRRRRSWWWWWKEGRRRRRRRRTRGRRRRRRRRTGGGGGGGRGVLARFYGSRVGLEDTRGGESWSGSGSRVVAAEAEERVVGFDCGSGAGSWWRARQACCLISLGCPVPWQLL
jgi:hypothetical protein